MTGKQEHVAQVKEKIDRMLEGKAPYFRSFYNSMVSSGRTGSYGTIFKYLQYVTTFVDSMDKPLNEIGYDDIVDWMAEYSRKENGESKSGSYMVAVYSALKKFFQYLEYSDKISKNPMNMIDRPAPKPSDQVKRTSLTKQELTTIFKAIRRRGGKRAKRDELMFALFLTTGMRCTALTEINIDDFNFDKKTVTIIEKRNKHREFALSDSVISLAKEWMAERASWETVSNSNRAMFVSSTGKRMTQLLVSNVVENCCKITGKHITPHKLRATCATLLSEDGLSIYEIQSFMGHQSPTTTEIYLQDKEEKVRKTSERASSFYIA